MKYKFSEVVDIPKLQNLMEALYLVSGIPSGIIDIDGKILVSVGWREICLKFHRVNRETEALCRQSDGYIAEKLHKNKPYICYTCANGLIDAAAPIIVDGNHLATIFQGQFFFEEPDVEHFRRQARIYGFDEDEYLKALAQVPIYSKDKLDSIMHFFRQLAELMAQMGLDQLHLIESKEEALQESEECMKTIINNTPSVSIQVYDEYGRIKYFNKASETMFGWVSNEVRGKTLDQLSFDKKSAKKFLELIKIVDETGRITEPIDWTFTNQEGIQKNLITIIFRINKPEGRKEFFSMDIDVTEKKHFEKEMYRFEQLNLIGEMAAGIAHEVRNPLTTVRGFLQLSGSKMVLRQDKELFDLMIQELDRANGIITEFLSLAKNKIINLELRNLNSVISTLTPLIEAVVREFDQNLKLDLGEIPELLLDEKEIRQLILNLAKNGIEAMSSGGGYLTIRTYHHNDGIIMEVQDDGEGINQAIINKIGIPFFTTKEKGTGLGLAVCYSIAARHNAKIAITSDSSGTTFIIRFRI